MTDNLWVALPLIWLASSAFLVGLAGRLTRVRNAWLATLTALACLGALILMVPAFAMSRARFVTGLPLLSWSSGGPHSVALEAAPGALVLAAVVLGLTLCSALYSGRYLDRDVRYVTYYPLLLLAVLGLLGMLWTTDLFNLYLFCELMSVATYVLVAFRRHTDTAIEAGFKYLILGSAATLTMVLGVAGIYYQTGQVALSASAVQGGWGRAGIACLIVGLSLKSGLVPLHAWLPDAYGRAPSSAGAILASVISKSTLVVLLRVSLGLGVPPGTLGMLFIGLAALNMTVGNMLALVQRNTKRLLAYSSIAQAGYVMFALGVGLRYDLPAALDAGFFLLIAHAILKSLAFLSKGACHFYLDATLITQLNGTAQRLPLVAVTFAVALAGLAGIPPLGGFVAKWFIIARSLPAGDALVYAGTALFLANSLLALGYYLPLIARLFAPTTEGETALRVSPWMGVPLLALSGLALAMGLHPQPWLEWVRWLTYLGGG